MPQAGQSAHSLLAAYLRRFSDTAPALLPAGRAPPKLYKIGEVIRYSGVSRQTVHNYTVLGLISEVARTPSGHRLYDEKVFEHLRRIGELKKHMTLQQIKRLFEKEKAKVRG